MQPRGPGRNPRGGPPRPQQNSQPATVKVETHVVHAQAPLAPGSNKHFSTLRFQDAPISAQSKAGIKHEFLSDVQASTITPALAGHDLLVQAKTGTGKTLAFLIPAIERLLASKNATANHISILVLSPTRELALQIEDEATALLTGHTFKVQHVIGGTNIKSEHQRLNKSPCDVLIATPGRLLDLLENYNLATKFRFLRTLVLDEADRLLDQGFKRELDKILALLPPKEGIAGTVGPRQTMLFSATVSKEVKGIAASALLPAHKFISTLHEDEVNTHEHVPQSTLILPFSSHLPAMLAILLKDAQDHPGTSKVMVFFPTARHVGLAMEALEAVRAIGSVDMNGIGKFAEIHSRKSQPARIKAADMFKDAKSAILLSSDVAARGMDFPGVTLVLQVGLPANGEQYIHRLGRTARAGAAGRGILVLAQPESYFLSSSATIRSLPFTTLPSPALTILPNGTNLLALCDAAVQAALLSGRVSDDAKSAAYRAWLGYYNGQARACGWDKRQLVDAANSYVIDSLGWRQPDVPGIQKRAIGFMGLQGVAGINVDRSGPGGGGGNRGRGGGRGGPPRAEGTPREGDGPDRSSRGGRGGGRGGPPRAEGTPREGGGPDRSSRGGRGRGSRGRGTRGGPIA